MCLSFEMNVHELEIEATHQSQDTSLYFNQTVSNNAPFMIPVLLHFPVISVCLLRCRVNNINTGGETNFTSFSKTRDSDLCLKEQTSSPIICRSSSCTQQIITILKSLKRSKTKCIPGLAEMACCWHWDVAPASSYQMILSSKVWHQCLSSTDFSEKKVHGLNKKKFHCREQTE